MRRRNADLLAVAVTAGAAAIVVLRVQSVPLRTAFALPLLLVLPGYSVTEAVFARRRLDGAHRVLLTIGLSISVAILAALGLDFAQVGLRATSWAVVLVVVTWASCASAVRSREPEARSRSPLPRIRLVDAVLLVAGALVAAGAVAFARTPLPAKNAQGYTALWLQPSTSGTGASVLLGMASGELQTLAYRLELRVGSRVVYERRLSLEPGRRWRHRVNLGGARTVGRAQIGARLYRASQPQVVYRSVRLQPAVLLTRTSGR